MIKGLFTLKSNVALNKTVYEMKLTGDCSGLRCGQFVEVSLEPFFLRRPFGVADVKGDELTLIYKVVGAGTQYMTTLEKGAKLDILTRLGNGFDLSKSKSPLNILTNLELSRILFSAIKTRTSCFMRTSSKNSET